MKVEGFSQAMEFEEHRGTVIYSTVHMFGHLCWTGEVGDLWI